MSGGEEFVLIFGILIIVIMFISFIVKLLKQPIIIGYVLAGIAFAAVIGTGMFTHGSETQEQVIIFSEIGITFLLFLMGMEFDLKSLKYLGKDVFLATFLQCGIFLGVAFGIAFLLGFTIIQSLYLGLLFMFTSTLLDAKWLDDKKESQTLHGKIILSILIIEDLIAIIVLTIMSILKESSLMKIALVPLEGILLLVIAFVLARYVLNAPLKFSSKYPELLFVFSLSICFLFVELAPKLGYSTTIGAFIGGIVLGNTLFKAEVLTRLKPLVVFFNMLFFVGLGFQMNFNMDFRMLVFLCILMVLTLTFKPFVAYLNLRLRGYDLKTSFLSGIYMSNLSEFAIIIVATGILSGMIDSGFNTIVVIAVILSMILSSYLIKYDKQIFKWAEPRIIKFDRRFVTKDVKIEPVDPGCNILFFGYYDLDRDLMLKFKEMGKKIAVIENDPENLALLKKEGVKSIYGSVNNPDFFEQINFQKVELAVSSIIDVDENKMIIHEVKKESPKAVVIVTAKNLKSALELYSCHADYVIYQSMVNEQKVSSILKEYTTDVKKVIDKKIFELAKLREKEEKLQASHEGEFYDIEHIFKNKRNKHATPLEKEEEHRRELKDEVVDYLEKGL